MINGLYLYSVWTALNFCNHQLKQDFVQQAYKETLFPLNYSGFHDDVPLNTNTLGKLQKKFFS